MHPILARLDHTALYLGAWLTAAALLAASLTRQGVDAVDALTFVVPTFMAYAFVALSGWYVCRAVPVTSGSVPTVVAAAAGAALSGGLFWLLLANAWLAMLRVFPADRPLSAAVAGQTPFLFAAAVILYLLVLSVHHVAYAYDAAREADRQRLEFQVATRDAELRALRAQLNPHFLYNSLNSISALTSTDPAGARRMCLLLGDFLRRTLKASALDRIQLADELSLVDAFVAIEQIRYGARLAIARTVSESALTCLVPPLLLQPLMENAVVHGVAGLVDGGTIRLLVAREGDRLFIRIENPYDADVLPRRQGGVGLENVRRRVRTAFVDRARLEAHADAGTFRVDLHMPAVEE